MDRLKTLFQATHFQRTRSCVGSLLYSCSEALSSFSRTSSSVPQIVCSGAVTSVCLRSLAKGSIKRDDPDSSETVDQRGTRVDGGSLKARSLCSIVVLSLFFLLTGLIVLSPSAGFLLLVLAALAAAIPALAGRGTLRIIAIILLLLSITFGVVTLPHCRSEQRIFLQRGKELSR